MIFKHVGAVLGERAGGGRSGEDPGQVEHADARQRAVAFGQPFPRAVADLHDLHQRQRGDRRGLRMLRPFGHAAHHAAGALGVDDRLLELERIPGRHGTTHRVAVFRHAEDLERGLAMVREIGVDIAPAPVLRRIDAHHRGCARSTRKRRPSACNARCAARRPLGADRPRPPVGVRCAVPRDRPRRGRSRRGRRRPPPRCGTGSAIPGRRRR